MLSTPLRDGWTLDPKRLPLVAVAEDVGLPPDDYSLNRPGFTGGQNSRRIAHYGTDIKEENL